MGLNRQVDEWLALRPEGVTARSVAHVTETLRLAIADIATLAADRDAKVAALRALRGSIEDELSSLESEVASAAGRQTMMITVKALGAFLDRVHEILAEAWI